MRVLAPEMFVMLNALTHIGLYLDLLYLTNSFNWFLWQAMNQMMEMQLAFQKQGKNCPYRASTSHKGQAKYSKRQYKHSRDSASKNRYDCTSSKSKVQ